MNTNQTISPQRLIYMQPQDFYVDPTTLLSGYRGVAAAFLIDGVECLIIAKDCNDLIVIDDQLNPGVDNFNPNLTHRVAVITQDVVSLPVAVGDVDFGQDKPVEMSQPAEEYHDEETFDVQVYPKTAVPVDDDDEL